MKKIIRFLENHLKQVDRLARTADLHQQNILLVRRLYIILE